MKVLKTKTYVDKEGYIVTKDVYEEVEIEDDEGGDDEADAKDEMDIEGGKKKGSSVETGEPAAKKQKVDPKKEKKEKKKKKKQKGLGAFFSVKKKKAKKTA